VCIVQFLANKALELKYFILLCNELLADKYLLKKQNPSIPSI